jgi:hypothetical protein
MKEQKILDGGIIKIGKNQIFQDEDGLFIVEQYLYTDNGTDMFACWDSFKDLENAIKIAKRLIPESQYK